MTTLDHQSIATATEKRHVRAADVQKTAVIRMLLDNALPWAEHKKAIAKIEPQEPEKLMDLQWTRILQGENVGDYFSFKEDQNRKRQLWLNIFMTIDAIHGKLKDLALPVNASSLQTIRNEAMTGMKDKLADDFEVQKSLANAVSREIGKLFLCTAIIEEFKDMDLLQSVSTVLDGMKLGGPNTMADILGQMKDVADVLEQRFQA